MKKISLLLLCVPILSGCALFGEPSEQEYDIFARPLENRIVEVPVFRLEEVVNEDGTTSLEKLKRQVTIRDLATHTSGIAYSFTASPQLQKIYAKERLSPYFFIDNFKI